MESIFYTIILNLTVAYGCTLNASTQFTSIRLNENRSKNSQFPIIFRDTSWGIFVGHSLAMQANTPIHQTRRTKHKSFDWTPIGKEDFYRCPYIQKNIYGTFRCTHVCRKKYIKIHMQNGKHTFDLPADQDPEFPTNYQMNLDIMNARTFIREKTAIMCAKLGISVRAVCSNVFTSYLEDIVEKSRALPATANSRTVIGRPSQQEMNTLIAKKSNEIFNSTIREMLDAKYVSLLADAGTIHNLKIIHIVLINPFTG